MVKVEDKGKRSACEQMAYDRTMLAAGREDPVLLFYRWENFSITYGLFAGPEGILKKTSEIEAVVRPTGGGIFFHENDFPFSLYVPMAVKNFTWDLLWAKIQAKIIQRLQSVLEAIPAEFFKDDLLLEVRKGRFCLVEAHGCDFVWKGKKFGGASFRKGKKGFLSQATLFVGDFPWTKACSCLEDCSVIENMKERSVSLSSSKEKISRTDLKHVVSFAVEEAINESRGA